MHTAELLICRCFEFEIAIEKEKSSSDVIQAGGNNTLSSEIHKRINSVFNKEELLYQWKESITVPVYEGDKKVTAVIINGYHCYQLHTKLSQS